MLKYDLLEAYFLLTPHLCSGNALLVWGVYSTNFQYSIFRYSHIVRDLCNSCVFFVLLLLLLVTINIQLWSPQVYCYSMQVVDFVCTPLSSRSFQDMKRVSIGEKEREGEINVSTVLLFPLVQKEF